MLRLRLLRLATTFAVVFALGAGPVTSAMSRGHASIAITNALPSFADPSAPDEATALDEEPAHRVWRQRRNAWGA